MDHPLTDEERGALEPYFDPASGFLTSEGLVLIEGAKTSSTGRLIRARLIQFLWERAEGEPARFAVLCQLPMTRARALIRQFSLKLVSFTPKERLDRAMALLTPVPKDNLSPEDLKDDLLQIAASGVELLRENLKHFESLSEVRAIVKDALTLHRLLEGKPTSIGRTEHQKPPEGETEEQKLERERDELKRKLEEVSA